MNHRFCTFRGDSALTMAAGSGHTDVVRVLLMAKADVFLINNEGLSSIELAARYGSARKLETSFERSYMMFYFMMI